MHVVFKFLLIPKIHMYLLIPKGYMYFYISWLIQNKSYTDKIADANERDRKKNRERKKERKLNKERKKG